MAKEHPLALVQLFRTLGGFSAEETAKILALWQHQFTLQKNEYLSTPDRRDHYIYFVITGAFRIYCVDLQGEEVCLGFSYDNSLAGSYPSLVTGKPADLYVQALRECELIAAVWEDLVALSQEIPAIERFRRILAEETLLGRMQREIEMLTLTPAERYQKFLQRSAHLLQLIPQKHIASYLGMTPETLSRIRSKI
ncbi:MAG: Crp/Fnr family transcriptional regulator [Saprospiraceae bacterium]